MASAVGSHLKFFDGHPIPLQDAQNVTINCSQISLCKTRTGQRNHFLGKPLQLKGKFPSQVSQGKSSRMQVFALNVQTAESSKGGGLLDFFFGIFKGKKTADMAEPLLEPQGTETKEYARSVFVAGATGRTGTYIVKQLLEKGWKVVALTSSSEKAEKLVEGTGVNAGEAVKGKLVTAVGSVLDEFALEVAMTGCDSVVCALGSKYTPNGFAEGSAPEDIYSKLVPALIQASRKVLEGKPNVEKKSLTIFDFQQSEILDGNSVYGSSNGLSTTEAPSDSQNGTLNGGVTNGGISEASTSANYVDGWVQLNDGIMGGISDGTFRRGQDSAVFEGILRSEGGGFSSTRGKIPNGPVDLSSYDGISLRVKGDGQRYKLTIRTEAEFKGTPYAAMFDTVRNMWTDVFIPFDQFKAVSRASIVDDAPPLDVQNVHSIQMLATLFQFNKQLNPLAYPGAFRLEVESIGAYRKERPQFLLISSAAVERNARIQSPQEREMSIPIVKLNPGNVLTWKLHGEDTLKASGLRYTVVRPCGLTDKDMDQAFNIEVGQGDCITGLLSREEAARVCVEVLDSPSTVNTTFEVRRDDLTKGLEMSNWGKLFTRLRPDVRPNTVQTVFETPKESET